jgi:hypothetical protein
MAREGREEGSTRDPVLRAAADLLRAAEKAGEFKAADTGATLSFTVSGRILGADDTTVTVSVTKGTPVTKA